MAADTTVDTQFINTHRIHIPYPLHIHTHTIITTLTKKMKMPVNRVSAAGIF